jgi:hypothetical protein
VEADVSERISSLEEFWPFYLNEHKDPVSRRLHFVGTTGWFASVAASTVLNPIGFPLAMAGFAALCRQGVKNEAEKPSFKHVAAMLALPTLASPVVFPAGVVFAYGCAWVGHFKYEHNRPATFKYPTWSLVSDWKMWAQMAQGKLWSGEDPAGELGLAEPPAKTTNGKSAHAATPA